MASREKLYERPLKRALDDQLKAEILQMFQSKRQMLPSGVEMKWHPKDPILILRGPMGVAFYVHFHEARKFMEVYVELGFMARQFVTEAHRSQAKDVVHQIAEDLDL